jgi:hypothetical protein
MFVIPGADVGGGASSFLSCSVLPSVSACRRASNLLVIFIRDGCLFLAAYSFSLLAFLWFWGVFFSCD